MIAGALCAQADPDLFFPPAGSDGQEAKQVCERCPVAQACLAEAMRVPAYGVWGGTTYTQRRELARRAGQTYQAPNGMSLGLLAREARPGVKASGAVIEHGSETMRRRHLRAGEACASCWPTTGDHRPLLRGAAA